MAMVTQLWKYTENTKLCILKEYMLWCVNYISIKV